MNRGSKLFLGAYLLSAFFVASESHSAAKSSARAKTNPGAAMPAVDRSRLPEALRTVPLNRLSSGALMLLDRNGDLVRPPAASAARSTSPSAADAALLNVALDPRIGGNIRLGDDPAPLPANMRAQAEPHIFRSVVNADFLAATFQEGRFTDGGAVDCGYSISSDGGLNWSRALIPGLTTAVGGPYYRATDPVAGIDLSGNVYLNTDCATDVSFNNGKLVMSKSTDGGQTFGAPVVVYTPPTTAVFPDKNWMAINTFAATPTAGRIVVTYSRFTSTTSPIARLYSNDGGATWSSSAFVHSSATDAQGSQPIFLPSGKFVIIYWNFGNSSLQIVNSSDGGITFGVPATITAVSQYTEPSIRSGGFLPSAVASRVNGNIYVTYQGYLGGNPRILFTKFTASTSTWSTPIAITDNPAGSGVFNPAIAVSPDGQTLTTVFYDHRDNPGSNVLVDLYLAQSFDGGATWQPNVRVTSTSTDASLAPLTADGYMLGDYQGIAEPTTANVPAIPVWIDTRTGNPDPFVARIGIAPQLNYTSWQAARLSLGQINNPKLGGKTGNADFDGKTNLLEYALGTSPAVPDAVAAMITQTGSTFSITYPRLKAATDVTLHAFRSVDLSASTWTQQDVTETLLQDGPIQIWQASTPANGRMFFRLQAQ
ncbi:MAG: sialidase family protein [Spartobacteria bacterium]